MTTDYCGIHHDIRQRVLAIRGQLADTVSIYPDVGASGYFCFRSQTIQLLQMRSSDFRAAISERRYGALLQDVQTIFHELTHWADCLGSLWGQKHLLEVFAAYDVVLNDKPEADYWTVTALYDAGRRIRYPQYYRTVRTTSTPPDVRTPWQYAYSAGWEFDPYGRIGKRPILFVRFLDHYTGELAVRQPLTVGALLETLAMWSEMKTGLETIALLKPDERVVETGLWTRRIIKYMYNPTLTEYTAPAHILSAGCGIGEVLSTYHHAALLAQIALNFPPRLLAKIQVEGFSEETNGAFRRFADPGFVYVALCRSAPASSPDADPAQWLDNTLSLAGLPSRAEILDEATQIMRDLFVSLPEEATVPRLLVDLGITTHGARSAAPEPSLTLVTAERDKLTLPPLFDADGDILLLNDRYPDPTIWHAVEMYEAEAKLHTWTANFLSACR
jgi:hypothetical protein